VTAPYYRSIARVGSEWRFNMATQSSCYRRRFLCSEAFFRAPFCIRCALQEGPQWATLHHAENDTKGGNWTFIAIANLMGAHSGSGHLSDNQTQYTSALRRRRYGQRQSCSFNRNMPPSTTSSSLYNNAARRTQPRVEGADCRLGVAQDQRHIVV
jgi:hypothetical protein